jgi:hypothetical protein
MIGSNQPTKRRYVKRCVNREEGRERRETREERKEMKED